MIFDGKGIRRGMKRAVYIIFAAVVIMAGSCKHIDNLSDVPAIEFRTFTLFDTVDILGNPAKAGTLEFSFEDGDGDLGLDAPVQPGIDPSSNLFLRLYRKTGNSFELAGPSDPLYPSEYRIPYLEPGGQNKILKGTIDVTLIYFLYSVTDTLYYDFWIKDRGGHESNTAATCVFVLSENGTCGAE